MRPAKIVSQEATALATLYRDVGAYPDSPRAQLQDELRDYAEYVIEEAWPEQHKAGSPSVASNESTGSRRFLRPLSQPPRARRSSMPKRCGRITD